ncbi:MAG: hypothetical protein CM1200mP32_04820 [Methanobacteriota archaeon]|nr:MAG: hypothetical protein CM1200mP32_04820 [Euryarchaeota archaeon]
MSGHNHDLISADGTLDVLEEAGALVLRDTAPRSPRTTAPATTTC